MKQKEEDLVVDLNNNSVNKTEAPTPQRQRKATFGPFETSYEEETPDEPNLLTGIQWDPIMEPFSNNPLDNILGQLKTNNWDAETYRIKSKNKITKASLK